MKLNIYTGLIIGFMTITANAGDIKQGQTKSAICAGCHGANGIGLSSEYPNLAGQKKGYLVKQLKDFKQGKRTDPTMAAMVLALNNQDIDNLAAYYSSLKAIPMVIKKQQTVTQKASTNEFPETTFITMKKSATLETFPQEITWQGGENMLYNAITPDAKLVLATSPSKNSVYIFNAKTGSILAVVKVGKAPKGVKVSPDGKVAYISNQGSNNISVVDLINYKVVNTIKTGKGPHNARFTQDGKRAYVTLQGGEGIGVIDTQLQKMIKIIPVAGITGPHNLDLSKDEKIAFVRDFVHHVAVLDLQTGQVKKVLMVGNGHGGIDVTPDGRYAATAAIGDNFISVIDTQSYAVTNIIVGNGPHGIRASKDSRWLYVTITKENQVAVIDMQTMKVVKKISVGKFPFWIAVQGNF